MINNKFLRFLISICLILVIILLLTNLKGFFAPLISIFSMLIIPIIISLFLYYALRPAVRKLEKAKVHRGLMVLSVILGFALLFVVFIAYGGTVLKSQFEDAFLENLSTEIDVRGLLDNVLDFIPDDFIPKNINLTNEILNKARQLLLDFSRNIIGLISKIGDIGTQVVLVPFILFYLLKDDRKFFKAFMSIMPKRYNKDIKNAIKNIDSVLSTYISSQLLVSFILGILMFVGYLIIGLPNALLMAFFAMITNIIPFIGPFLGAVPAVLIAFTINWKMVLKVIILAVVIQQAEGDFVTPKIVGEKLKLHPLGVMFIILISVSLFGIFGAFIGVPLYLILSILIKAFHNIYGEKRKEKFE